jgi:hypothetical protein
LLKFAPHRSGIGFKAVPEASFGDNPQPALRNQSSQLMNLYIQGARVALRMHAENLRQEFSP